MSFLSFPYMRAFPAFCSLHTSPTALNPLDIAPQVESALLFGSESQLLCKSEGEGDREGFWNSA